MSTLYRRRHYRKCSMRYSYRKVTGYKDYLLALGITAALPEVITILGLIVALIGALGLAVYMYAQIQASL